MGHVGDTVRPSSTRKSAVWSTPSSISAVCSASLVCQSASSYGNVARKSEAGVEGRRASKQDDREEVKRRLEDRTIAGGAEEAYKTEWSGGAEEAYKTERLQEVQRRHTRQNDCMRCR